ncbi:MAG: YhdP family protein [Gammaproteobacteria bacterium]
MKARLRLLKIIGEVLIIVLIVSAISVGLLRAFFPYISHYQGHFEKLASQALHRPVKIGAMKASWHTISPSFQLNNVQIFDPQGQQAVLTVKQFQINVNVLASLWHRQLKTRAFHLNGSQLVIHQYSDGNYDVNGIKLHFAEDKDQKQFEIQNLLEWLQSQGDIALDDLTIDWYGKDGLHLPITDVQLKFNRGFFHNQVIGLATLSQDPATRVRFVVNLNALALTASQVHAKAYLYLKNVNLPFWLKDHQWQGLTLIQGKLPEARVWATWQNKKLHSIQAVVNAQDVQAQLNREGEKPQNIVIDDVRSSVVWESFGKGWSLAVNPVFLSLDHHPWSFQTFSIQNFVTGPQSTVKIYRLDRFSLDALQHLPLLTTLLPEALQQHISQLQPKGVVRNIMIRDERNAGQKNFSAAVHLDNIQWRNQGKIPGMEHLSGDLKLTSTMGDLQLQGKDLVVADQAWFKQPLAFKAYQAHVQWLKQTDAWKLKVSQLHLNDLAIEVVGDTEIDLKAQQSPFVRLLAKASIHDVKKIANYLPLNFFSPKLSEWLQQAFKGGDHIDVEALLQGPLKDFPFDQQTGRFEIIAHAHNVNLNYAEGWPNLTGLTADVIFDDRSMRIQARQGQLLGVPIHATQAYMQDLAHSPLLIQGDMQGKSQQGLDFLAHSPLNETFGPVLKQLTINGTMQSHIHLSIPFHNDEPIQVDGQAKLLPHNILTFPNWHITLTELQGLIHFTQDSMSSVGLQAKWLNQPLALSMLTQPTPKGGSTTRVSAKGATPVNTVLDHYQLNLLKPYLQGQTAFVASVLATKKSEHASTRIVIGFDSNLQGVAINLPEPFKKLPSEKMPTHVEIVPESQTDALNFYGYYGDQLSAAAKLMPNKKHDLTLSQANIRFGDRNAQLPNVKGITITGNIANFDWDALMDELKSILPQSKQQSFDLSTHGLPINRVDLHLGQYSLFGLKGQQLQILALPGEEGWSLMLNSPNIIGRLWLPIHLMIQPIQGDFQRFNYLSTPPSPKKNQTVSPGKIPGLNLNIQNFSYNNKLIGRMNVVARPQGNSLLVERFTLTSSYFNLNAKGMWLGVGNNQQSMITGNFNSQNMGAALKAWGVTGSLKGAKGDGNFNLSWLGPLYDPDFAKLNGQFSFNFKSGRIVNISQGSEAEMGIGRILNLLSLQNLPRRLSLDFSDLFAEGFPFDTLKGNFRIQNGNAISNDTSLNGPIAKVDMTGKISLGNKTYDLTLIITPYVTASLPVVATIAGGPVAGAAAWVANKVFGKVVNQLTAQSYHVTGPWDNPQMDKI